MSYIYLEAPHYLGDKKIDNWQKTVFLAGSITGAENWQNRAASKLIDHFNIFNPRRADFDTSNKKEERAQIIWEWTLLNIAEIVLFYFSHETLAPISLFELGALLEQQKTHSYKKLYICIHPEYKRKNDVIIQTELRNTQFARNIKFNLDETLNLIITNHSNEKEVKPQA